MDSSWEEAEGAVRSSLGLLGFRLGLAFFVAFNTGARDGAAYGEGEVTTPETE